MRTLFFILLLTCSCPAFAQDTTMQKLYLVTGLGNYEYLWGGIGFTIKQRIYTEAGIGMKPWYFGTKYTQAHASAGMLITRKKKRLKNFTTSVHAKCFLWQLENEFNYFLAIGVGPELRMAYKETGRFQPVLNIGGIYSSVIKYERKTFMEAGWPREFQPSFSIQLNYRLK